MSSGRSALPRPWGLRVVGRASRPFPPDDKDLSDHDAPTRPDIFLIGVVGGGRSAFPRDQEQAQEPHRRQCRRSPGADPVMISLTGSDRADRLCAATQVRFSALRRLCLLALQAWLGAIVFAFRWRCSLQPHRQLGRNWSQTLELREGHTLVTMASTALCASHVFGLLPVGSRAGACSCRTGSRVGRLHRLRPPLRAPGRARGGDDCARPSARPMPTTRPHEADRSLHSLTLHRGCRSFDKGRVPKVPGLSARVSAGSVFMRAYSLARPGRVLWRTLVAGCQAIEMMGVSGACRGSLPANSAPGRWSIRRYRAST